MGTFGILGEVGKQSYPVPGLYIVPLLEQPFEQDWKFSVHMIYIFIWCV